MFPSFFRVISSDKSQSIGMAQLLLNFGWTWVGFVASDNDYGLQGIYPIKEELLKAGACVAFTEYIRLGQPDRNAPRIVQTIKESTARVVVVFAYEVDVIPIVNEMIKQNVRGRIIIGNTGWARSILLSTSNYFQVLNGTLGLTANEYVIPGLDRFLKNTRPHTSTGPNWGKQYWEKIFNCTFPYGDTVISSVKTPIRNCTGMEQLDEVMASSTFNNSQKYNSYMYASVYVLAKALSDLKICRPGEGPFSNRTCANIWNFKPWQVNQE